MTSRSSTATSTTRRAPRRRCSPTCPAQWRRARAPAAVSSSPSRRSARRSVTAPTSAASIPRATPRAARVDAWPPSGAPPASDLGVHARAAARRLRHRVRRADADAGRRRAARPRGRGAALASAINDWQIAEWLDPEPRLRASINVAYEDGELAAREIHRVADDPRFVQVLLLIRTAEPLGRGASTGRSSRPAVAARPAARRSTSAAGAAARSPAPASRPSTSRTRVGMATAFQDQLTSLVCEGVFERFPQLRIVLIEGGIAWVAPLMWRLDRAWSLLRAQAPRPDAAALRADPRARLADDAADRRAAAPRRLRRDARAAGDERPHHVRDRLPALGLRLARRGRCRLARRAATAGDHGAPTRTRSTACTPPMAEAQRRTRGALCRTPGHRAAARRRRASPPRARSRRADASSSRSAGARSASSTSAAASTSRCATAARTRAARSAPGCVQRGRGDRAGRGLRALATRRDHPLPVARLGVRPADRALVVRPGAGPRAQLPGAARGRDLPGAAVGRRHRRRAVLAARAPVRRRGAPAPVEGRFRGVAGAVRVERARDDERACGSYSRHSASSARADPRRRRRAGRRAEGALARRRRAARPSAGAPVSPPARSPARSRPAAGRELWPPPPRTRGHDRPAPPHRRRTCCRPRDSPFPPARRTDRPQARARISGATRPAASSTASWRHSRCAVAAATASTPAPRCARRAARRAAPARAGDRSGAGSPTRPPGLPRTARARRRRCRRSSTAHAELPVRGQRPSSRERHRRAAMVEAARRPSRGAARADRRRWSRRPRRWRESTAAADAPDGIDRVCELTGGC